MSNNHQTNKVLFAIIDTCTYMNIWIKYMYQFFIKIIIIDSYKPIKFFIQIKLTMHDVAYSAKVLLKTLQDDTQRSPFTGPYLLWQQCKWSLGVWGEVWWSWLLWWCWPHPLLPSEQWPSQCLCLLQWWIWSSLPTTCNIKIPKVE